MESIEKEYLANELKTDLSRSKSNLTKNAKKVSSSLAEIEGKQVFSYKLDKTTSSKICLLEEPVVTIKKLGSDALLRVQEKLSDLQNQLELQRKKLLKAEEEKLFLQEQLLDHSKFSTRLGAVLGNLLWHASNIPKVIDIWIKKFQLHSKFDEFLGAVNGTFSSFIKTYGEADLSIESDECQFVMSLLGVTANASAIPEGRQFIVTQSSGEELVKNLVTYFSYLQTPPRYSLWRLILTILYNISVNETGVQWLLDFKVSENVLSQCLKQSTPKDISLLCLRILHSVTCDLVDPKHLQEILQCIPLERIDKIALNGEHQMVTIAREIKKNLKNAKSILLFRK